MRVVGVYVLVVVCVSWLHTMCQCAHIASTPTVVVDTPTSSAGGGGHLGNDGIVAAATDADDVGDGGGDDGGGDYDGVGGGGGDDGGADDDGVDGRGFVVDGTGENTAIVPEGDSDGKAINATTTTTTTTTTTAAAKIVATDDGGVVDGSAIAATNTTTATATDVTSAAIHVDDSDDVAAKNTSGVQSADDSSVNSLATDAVTATTTTATTTTIAAAATAATAANSVEFISAFVSTTTATTKTDDDADDGDDDDDADDGDDDDDADDVGVGDDDDEDDAGVGDDDDDDSSATTIATTSGEPKQQSNEMINENRPPKKVYANFYDEFYGISEEDKIADSQKPKRVVRHNEDGGGDVRFNDIKYDYSFYDTFYGDVAKREDVMGDGGDLGREEKATGSDVFGNLGIDKTWKVTVGKMIEELTDFLDKNDPCVLMRKKIENGGDENVVSNGTGYNLGLGKSGGGGDVGAGGGGGEGGGEGGEGEEMTNLSGGVRLQDSSSVGGVRISDLKTEALREMEKGINYVFEIRSNSCSGGDDDDDDDADGDGDGISNNTTNDEININKFNNNNNSNNSDNNVEDNDDDDNDDNDEVSLARDSANDTLAHKRQHHHHHNHHHHADNITHNATSRQHLLPEQTPSPPVTMDTHTSKNDNHHHHNHQKQHHHHHEHHHQDVHHHHYHHNQPQTHQNQGSNSNGTDCRRCCEEKEEEKGGQQGNADDVGGARGSNSQSINNNNNNNNNNQQHQPGPHQTRGRDLSGGSSHDDDDDDADNDEDVKLCYNQQSTQPPCINIFSQESVVSQLCTKMTSLDTGNRCMTSRLAANRKKTQGRVSRLEAEVTYLKRTVEILQRSAMFYAHAPFGASQVRGYKVKVTQGQGFEPMSGFFRAPYDGIYQITVGYFRQTMSNTDDSINVMLDSKVIYRLHVDAEEEQRMFMTSLASDQSLWLKTSLDHENEAGGGVGGGLDPNFVQFGVMLIK